MSKNVKGGTIIKENTEKIFKEWIEYRGDTLNKLSKNSEDNTLDLDNQIKNILNNVQEDRKAIVEEQLEKMIYSFMDYSKEINEIYYKAGFGDCLSIVIETLGK